MMDIVLKFDAEHCFPATEIESISSRIVGVVSLSLYMLRPRWRGLPRAFREDVLFPCFVYVPAGGFRDVFRSLP